MVRAYHRTPRDCQWIIHAAEGTDDEAGGELERLEQLGCLGPNTLIVHGVGLRETDRAKLIARGRGLIWCPASNFFTLGATAEVCDLARAGRVALGSDSRLSGSRDLLEELKCAAQTGQVAACALFRMVTCDAAALLRLPGAGRLRPGLPADLLVLPPLAADPYEVLLKAERKDILLVMRDGRPLLSAPEFASAFEITRVQPRRIRVDGEPKLLARPLAQRLAACSIHEPGVECAW